MPITPKFFIRWVANRYVAGSDLSDAVEVMKKLSLEEACFTVDVLGEEISKIEEADYFFNEYSNLIDAIMKNNLDANISLKPTAFGLLIDYDIAKIHSLMKTVHIQSDDDFTAPEIYEGIHDYASDIYSLGFTLYYMLTAKHIYNFGSTYKFSQKM